MALAFGTDLGSWGASTNNPINRPVTLAANSKVLVVMLINDSTAQRGGGSPTFAGTTMSQAGTSEIGASEFCVELFYLINPSLSSGVTLSIPNSNADTIYYYYISFTTTAAATYFDKAQGSNTTANPSLTINNVPAGGATVAVLGDGYKSAPTGASHTILADTDQGAFSTDCQYGLIASLSNVTMSWTVAADNWSMVMAAFQEAAAGQMLGGTVSSGSRLVGPTPHLYMKLRAGSVASGTAVAAVPLRLKMGLRGTIASTTSTVMGKLRLYMKLGVVVASATRTVAGTPHLIMKFGGAITSASAFIANLTGTGSRLLAGVIASGTSFTARFSLSMFFGGVIASGTSIIGNLINQGYKYLGGIIASVTSIFGTPGVSGYWTVAGVTEPQHYWPFYLTGDYTDQGSTGGLDLTEGGTGNSFSTDGLVLDGNGWASCANNADVCDVGSTVSVLVEVHMDSYVASFCHISGGGGIGLGWRMSGGGNGYGVRTYNPYLTAHDIGINDISGYAGVDVQFVWTLAGGNGTLYANGGVIVSPTALVAPIASTGAFLVGASYPSELMMVGTVKRAGVLKGEAWSDDDVAAIYAATTSPALGVNITIRKFLSGVIASATEVLGDVTRVAAAVLQYLSGVIVSGTAVVGNLLQAFNLQGTISSGTSVLGQISRGLHLSGVIQSVTSVLGRLKLAMGLSGRVVSTTAVLGMLKMGRRLSGVIVSGTAVLGRITLAIHLSGIITSTTSVLGNLFGITTQFLAGVIVSGTAVIMDIKRYGTHLLSGVIASATAVTGGLLIRRFLSGVIASATAVTGMVSRGLYLTGSIITTSTILGAIKQVPTQFLSGAIASGTYVYGGLKNVGAKYLAGVIATATYVFGNFSDIPAGGVVAGTRHFLKAFKGRLFQMYNRAKKNLHIEP